MMDIEKIALKHGLLYDYGGFITHREGGIQTTEKFQQKLQAYTNEIIVCAKELEVNGEAHAEMEVKQGNEARVLEEYEIPDKKYKVKLTSTHQVFQIVEDGKCLCGVHIGNYDNDMKKAEAFAFKIARLLNAEDEKAN